MEIEMELVVPDPGKSLSEGAIAPWNTPSYAHELEELLTLADDYDLPRNTPYRDLTKAQKTLIREGVPERKFGGLDGFFEWLEKRKYKMHIRVFLSRWRSYRTCPSCGGSRLRQESLATQVGQRNLAEICRMKIREAIQFFADLNLEGNDREVAKMLLQQISSRLGYLDAVGLGYLSLDRTLRTLSGGEAQRVALTSALGSSLVNMLYVLDEPSVGLHPHDMSCLVRAIEGLRDRGNTVVMVDHEEAMITAADHVIEIGPGAGADGGRVTYEGTPQKLRDTEGILTGDYLAGRRGAVIPERRREPTHGWIRLKGASGNDLKQVDAEFPLGTLCLVTGISGSGKSSLVEQTLYLAICRRKRKDVEKPLPFEDLLGDGQVEEVVMIDQSPIGRSPRSNPVTYIKAFDAIRSLFADTLSARTRNYKASHFSFNVDGGRCDTCQGDGYVQIDMQFLADVHDAMQQLPRPTLPPRCPGSHLPRSQHFRSLGDDRAAGTLVFSRAEQDSEPNATVDRRGARLSPARPGSQHTFRWRGATPETGWVPGIRPSWSDTLLARRTDDGLTLCGHCPALGLF